MLDQSRRFLPSTSTLAAFEAVARRGSFTAAADELDLTQSAVSRQIRQLEDQLGCRLFLRSSRRVEITPEGRIYAEAVGGALQAIRQASVRLMTGRGAGVLRLAVLPTFGTRWLMPRIPRFLRRNPGVTLDLVSRIGWFDLVAEGIDASIQHGTPEWYGGECTHLMGETLVPVASPGFLAERPVRGAADLLTLPLLHLQSRDGSWEGWFRDQGLAPPRAQGMRFEQFATAAQACIGGVGVALMPEFLIQAEFEAGDLVVIGPSKRGDSGYFLVQPTGPRAAASAAFRDWLLEEVGAEEG